VALVGTGNGKEFARYYTETGQAWPEEQESCFDLVNIPDAEV
jgi:hypothetical protein